MQPDDPPTPATIIRDLLETHPEAASLLAEASHRQALAAWSVADSELKFRAAQAARLACETLGHRLDPRRSRPVHFDVGSLLLVLLGAGLAVLDFAGLSGLPAGVARVPLALACTAVWLTMAWLAAVAVRRRRRAPLCAITGAAITLGLLLAVVHASVRYPGWPGQSGNEAFSVLVGASVLVLAAGTAALIAHMEPAGLLAARRHWYRARSGHDKAMRTRRGDLEAAVVAAEAWFGLVRAHATTIGAGEVQFTGETVTLAAALLDGGGPQLPPADSHSSRTS